MARENDFAILVGVGDYPNAGYGDLQGPRNDVEFLYDWLVDPLGGDVKPENIRKLVSAKPPKKPMDADYPPTEREIWAALKEIVFAGAMEPTLRLDGKLYLYFSGHGFSNFIDLQNHAAMYTANADAAQSSHVCGTRMVHWCAQAAAFGEIVLVMDCCRDKKVAKEIDPAPLDPIRNAAMSTVKKFEIYAVPFDGKAQEREFDVKGDGNKQMLGVLTYAFVRALHCAPPTSGKRTAGAIKNFIEGTWGSIVGEDRIEAPEFILPTRQDIELTTAPPRPIRRQARFSVPLVDVATLTVLDSAGQVVQHAEIEPAKHEVRWHDRTPGAIAVEPFDGNALQLDLLAEVYELRLSRAHAPDVATFVRMLGGDDVIISV